jgi:hypothetical protein
MKLNAKMFLVKKYDHMILNISVLYHHVDERHSQEDRRAGSPHPEDAGLQNTCGSRYQEEQAV